MAVQINLAKEKCKTGNLVLSMGVTHMRSVAIGRIAAASGIDVFNLDMEHGNQSLETIIDMCIAAQDAGVTPIVRVPGYEHYLTSRVLDGGAMGIIFPHVDSAELAKQLVSYTKFPPQGHRSWGGAQPNINYELMPQKKALKLVNDTIINVALLESPKAIENVEEIAAVKGLDVITIGSNDLCLEYGLPGQFGHKTIKAAFKRVAAAAKANGKTCGFGGISDEKLMREYIRMGFRWLQAGTDASFIQGGATAKVASLRKIHK